MASKKQSKMPVRKNYKSDKAFENAMLKYMIKLEPEMFGFKVTQREQMNKGGMMKKKGYAKGGTVSKNQPMTMDWFRKTIGTAEGRRLIGSGGGTGSSNSPSMILKKLMEKNTPTFKIDMSSKKKMIEKIKEMQGKKTAKAAKGGMMKKKGYAKGGAMKKKKGYAMGGMMPTQERKINPTTGMTMKKGGMIDMRKSGMFSKGGVIKRSRKR
mgnify:CR=1 FL=1|tara:strand:- start:1459 stop:2091 length:633 start_codon:yes stop_codon:yes gene_type:complete